MPEFAYPVTAIIKEAVETHTWPDIFKKEYHIPLKKIPIPESEDDLRGIGLTNWVSKQLERYVLNWIWPYVQPQIDPDQMGGVPGCSIEHYIVKMLHFILTSMDGSPNTAVLAVPVDFLKAFNRMLHSEIISNLVFLNVPPCATKLIQSYLTKRTMCVRYQKAESSFKSCPGGGPQGGLLTGILFILQVKNAGGPCPAIPSLGKTQAYLPANTSIQSVDNPSIGNKQPLTPFNTSTQAIQINDETTEISTPWNKQAEVPGKSEEPIIEAVETPSLRQVSYPLPLCHSREALHKKAFVDDLTLLEKISLSKLRKKNRIIGPPSFHDRFHLEFPAKDSILQHQLEDLKNFTTEHSMIINSKKRSVSPSSVAKQEIFCQHSPLKATLI